MKQKGNTLPAMINPDPSINLLIAGILRENGAGIREAVRNVR